jgi:hypothetical protein
MCILPVDHTHNIVCIVEKYVVQQESPDGRSDSDFRNRSVFSAISSPLPT